MNVSLFFITTDDLGECGAVGVGARCEALAWNIQHTDCQCFWRTWKAYTQTMLSPALKAPGPHLPFPRTSHVQVGRAPGLLQPTSVASYPGREGTKF